MIKKINSAIWHFENYVFQNWGIPSARNDQISKYTLKKYLPANPVVIDCGAHDGSDSIALARFFSKGVVHCFEPIPSLYETLAARAKGISNMHTYQLALADKNEIMKFYVSEGESDGSSSLLEPDEHLKDHPATLFQTQISVNALTLDEWAAQHGIKHVDLLWLDMQGYEMQMLKESKAILPTVKVIHTEVSTKSTYKGVSLYFEYRQFLESSGFKAVKEAIPNGWDMGNVLFVKK